MRPKRQTKKRLRRMAVAALGVAVVALMTFLFFPTAPGLAFIAAGASFLGLVFVAVARNKSSLVMTREQRRERRRIVLGVIGTSFGFATLLGLAVVLPFYRAWVDPASERAETWRSIGQASAVVLTTLGLGTLAVWQTLRGLKAQRLLEEERREFDRAIRDRDFVEAKAAEALGPQWRAEVLRLTKTKGRWGLNKSLKSHGISLEQLSRVEPEVRSAIEAKERSDARHYLEQTNPRAYEELRQRDMAEIEAAEQDAFDHADSYDDYVYELLGLSTSRELTLKERVTLWTQTKRNAVARWWAGD